MSEENRFQSWALVELFGHQRIAGLVSEQQLAGAGFVRVDVPPAPDANGRDAIAGYTRLFYPSAIYSITPMGEAECRNLAVNLHERRILTYLLNAPKLTEPEVED